MSSLRVLRVTAAGRQYSSVPQHVSSVAAAVDRLNAEVTAAGDGPGLLSLDLVIDDVDRAIVRAREVTSIEVLRTEDPGL